VGKTAQYLYRNVRAPPKRLQNQSLKNKSVIKT